MQIPHRDFNFFYLINDYHELKATIFPFNSSMLFIYSMINYSAVGGAKLDSMHFWINKCWNNLEILLLRS